jgi:hypothetical protein
MSDTTPVEQSKNVEASNNGSGSVGQPKNNDSLIKTVKFNLSDGRCDNFFKNNLRGDGSVIQNIFKLFRRFT